MLLLMSWQKFYKIVSCSLTMFDPKRINVASFSMHWECCHNGSVCLPLLGLHFTLWAWHDEIVAHEMPFDGKTDAFCFKKMRQVSNFFFPISLLTVNPCWGRCEPQCILVSLSFKKTLWGSQCQCQPEINGLFVCHCGANNLHHEHDMTR